MNRPDLYHKTVNILYDAYFNDTLKHGDCAACAVGNILCDASRISGVRVARWNKLFITEVDCGIPKRQLIAASGEMIIAITESGESCCLGNIISSLDTLTGLFMRVPANNNIIDEAHRLIAASGYSVNELAKVEYAFEWANQGNSKEDYMFNGLVAVLEALKEIHEVADEDLLQANHERFKRHYEKVSTV